MILTIIGARPQFVKAAVLSRAFNNYGIEEKIIHTGQHYDYKMNEVFFQELGLPGIELNLNIGSGSHGKQTADMLSGIEEVILKEKNNIDFVLVYGDTNSTLAGALAASKLHIPIIHVEAGLRSYNRQMPEEINRVITDHLSELLFCSSDIGKNQLVNEGVNSGVFVVGDIMLDALNLYTNIANQNFSLNNVLPKEILNHYNLMTIHRPSNTDDENKLIEIIEGIKSIGEPVFWPVHPRNKKRIQHLKIPNNLFIAEPLSYFEMIVALENSNKVITDSGGLQKEAYWKKKPCITIRNETEWVETVHDNWNILCQPEAKKIQRAFNHKIEHETWTPIYGDGKAAIKIIDVIKNKLIQKESISSNFQLTE